MLQNSHPDSSLPRVDGAPQFGQHIALFYNGEYLTNEQMNDKKFIKLIENQK